jgi:hypothetical protein
MAGLSSRAEPKGKTMVAATNGYDPVVVKRWLGEAMRVFDALEVQKVANMNACREIRAPLKDIKESAKNAGLPKKAFAALLKAELAERNYERALDNATPEDDDDFAAFEAMRAIARDGDLFDHAASKMAGDEEDVRPRSLREKEAARIARENTERLQAGVSGLPGADASEA